MDKVKDSDLRSLILQKYYDAREQEDFIPVNSDFFGDEIPIETLLRISEQLEEAELIELRPFYGGGKLNAAFGRINVKGVEVVEGALEKQEINDMQSANGVYAFISYQTAQKEYAGEVKEIFKEFSIESFLAHEDIEASQEWRTKILAEISKANIFVCLLSKEYHQSSWCVQESGIAAYRNITILPLSIDGEIPQGFISQYQSVKLRNGKVGYKEILECLVKYDFQFGIGKLIDMIGGSRSFRIAEQNFELIFPYINQINEAQAKNLLFLTRKNPQIHHATLCARKYIPKVLDKFGYLLEKEDLEFLQKTIAEEK